MNKITNARDLISALGADTVARAAGVGLKSVSAARVKNKLPASWYLGIKEAAAERQISPADDCFSFKRPLNSRELDGIENAAKGEAVGLREVG